MLLLPLPLLLLSFECLIVQLSGEITPDAKAGIKLPAGEIQVVAPGNPEMNTKSSSQRSRRRFIIPPKLPAPRCVFPVPCVADDGLVCAAAKFYEIQNTAHNKPQPERAAMGNHSGSSEMDRSASIFSSVIDLTY